MKTGILLVIVCFLLISSFTVCEAASDLLIVVDKEINVLSIIKDNIAIKHFLIATGEIVKGESLTPSGKFTVLNKVRDPLWGGGGYTDPIPGGDPKNPLGHYWVGTSAGEVPL